MCLFDCLFCSFVWCVGKLRADVFAPASFLIGKKFFSLKLHNVPKTFFNVWGVVLWEKIFLKLNFVFGLGNFSTKSFPKITKNQKFPQNYKISIFQKSLFPIIIKASLRPYEMMFRHIFIQQSTKIFRFNATPTIRRHFYLTKSTIPTTLRYHLIRNSYRPFSKNISSKIPPNRNYIPFFNLYIPINIPVTNYNVRLNSSIKIIINLHHITHTSPIQYNISSFSTPSKTKPPTTPPKA